MDDAIHQQFMNLVCALSPENLHCDGEISVAAANRKYRSLMRAWRALEAQLGRKVSEDEVWNIQIKGV